MGILKELNTEYYDNTSADFGNYREISLRDIIDSFTATYVGEGKLCEGVLLADITFHAIRSLQELSYDTLKCTRDIEVEIPSTLVLVMPRDYVNYVSLQWVDSNGIFRRLYPTSKSGNPFDVYQPVETWGGFTMSSGGAIHNGLSPTLGNYSVDGNYESTTSQNFKSQSSSDVGDTDADEIDDIYEDLAGGRYGLDPEHAQANGTFFIDERQGKFHFSSNVSGKTVVLKYISDGISGTSQGISLQYCYVPKLAEEAIYKHILYGVLSARKDAPAGILQTIKKERFAETRKAKLRLSNLKIEELTQILRGQSKIIKH